MLYTHMPFIFSFNGSDYMLCGGHTGRGAWRLYHSLLEPWAPRPTPTGSNSAIVECAPTAFVENGLVRLSALVGYRLHQYEGPTLDELTLIKADSDQHLSGAVTPTHILRADRQFVSVADRNDEPMRVIDMVRFGFPPTMRLTRLSFVPEDADKIIVTGASLPDGPRSIIYSLSQDRAWRITVMGDDVYKCAFGNDKIYHVVGRNDPKRIIAGSSDYDLVPL